MMESILHPTHLIQALLPMLLRRAIPHTRTSCRILMLAHAVTRNSTRNQEWLVGIRDGSR